MATQAIGKGEQTRERILAAAEGMVLRQGFTATSIDAIISVAGITRNGFFYHFHDKTELAKALLVRFREHDDTIFDDLTAQADALVDDPLHAFLAFLKLFAQVMADLPERHPGCLVASYCYQDQCFSSEIRELSQDFVTGWRRRFRSRLDTISMRYSPHAPVDLDALADLLVTLVEGGIILDKVRRDKRSLPRQVMLARSLIQMTFQPA
jgi:TetR/AcrR family transcriptional regulator, transcriptional repressor for nem operon